MSKTTESLKSALRYSVTADALTYLKFVVDKTAGFTIALDGSFPFFDNEEKANEIVAALNAAVSSGLDGLSKEYLKKATDSLDTIAAPKITEEVKIDEPIITNP